MRLLLGAADQIKSIGITSRETTSRPRERWAISKYYIAYRPTIACFGPRDRSYIILQSDRSACEEMYYSCSHFVYFGDESKYTWYKPRARARFNKPAKFAHAFIRYIILDFTCQ